MSGDNIRVRFLMLNDGAGKPIQNLLLYIKKLTRVGPVDGKILLGFIESILMKLFYSILWIKSLINDEVDRIFNFVYFYSTTNSTERKKFQLANGSVLERTIRSAIRRWILSIIIHWGKSWTKNSYRHYILSTLFTRNTHCFDSRAE